MVLKNEKGFTLAEVVIVGGITTVIALVGIQVTGQFSKSESTLIKKSDRVLSSKVSYGFLQEDLTFSFPSLSVLKKEAETVEGKCPTKNFWKLSLSTKHSECSLQVALDEDNEEFYIVKSKQEIGLNIHPSEFYTSSGSGVGFNPSKVSKFITDNEINPSGAFVKFESPVRLFDTDDSIFSTYYKLQQTNGEGAFTDIDEFEFNQQTLPISSGHCTITPNNFDQFLRCLPAQGETATVNINLVEVIKYRIEKSPNSNKEEKSFNLLRMQLRLGDDGLYYTKQLIGTDIKSITFTRPSITKPNIQFNIDEYKENDK